MVEPWVQGLRMDVGCRGQAGLVPEGKYEKLIAWAYTLHI